MAYVQFDEAVFVEGCSHAWWLARWRASVRDQSIVVAFRLVPGRIADNIRTDAKSHFVADADATVVVLEHRGCRCGAILALCSTLERDHRS